MAYGSHEMHLETVENYQQGFIDGLEWALDMLDAHERGVINLAGYAELLKAKQSEIEAEL